MNAIVNELINDGRDLLEKILQAKTGLPPAVTDPVLEEAETLIGTAVAKLGAHPAVAGQAGVPTAKPPEGGWPKTEPAATASGISTAATAVLAFGLLLFGLGAVGCASKPSTNHVVRIDATGGKIGITQNPVTGVYELGIQRVFTEITTVPVIYDTNKGEFKVTPTVSRYEANTHSAVFGNVAITSTLATGSNAVQTTLGGTGPAINTGTGTANNLTPLSH